MEGYDIPADAIEMLYKKGLTDEEITIIKNQFAGKGDSTFTINPNDVSGKNHCDVQIKFLSEVYKSNLSLNDPDIRATARLIANNPNREKIIKNYEDLRDGKKGVTYIFAKYITNFNDFAYYSVDTQKTLGVDVFPSHRRGYDAKGRHGCFRVADLAAAIDQQELSATDASRAKELAQKAYNGSCQITSNELNELNNIIAKVPVYTKDEMIWHENVDGHTIDLVPTGYLHAGSGGGDGLSHTGGHRLIEEAENIINNR
jgi:hypothetical protein